jgi:Tfp pilus assembly protein FimT
MQIKLIRVAQSEQPPSAKGFTLLETLVVVTGVGILATLLAPGWVGLLNTQRLNTGMDEVLQAIRLAQSEAKRHHLIWQFSIREQNGTVQWATHSASIPPASATWNNLNPAIQLDPETSLQAASGIHRVRFNENGQVNGQLGRVTLRPRSSARPQRCVIVSTLLGAIRTGKDHKTQQDGKYCY